jgi:hypothetical protein
VGHYVRQRDLTIPSGQMTLPQSLTLSPKVRLIPTPDIWPSFDLRSMTNLAFDFFFFRFSCFLFSCFSRFLFSVAILVRTNIKRPPPPPPPRSVALPACSCASCLRCPPPDSSYCRPSPLVLSPVVATSVVLPLPKAQGHVPMFLL